MYRFAMIRTLIVCAFLQICSQTTAYAAESKCGPYVVAFYELGSLYYRNEMSEYVGIDKDIIDELARRTHCTFTPVLESRVRIWSHLKNGTLDMTVSGIKTPEREQFGRFIIYFKSNNYLLVRHHPDESVNSLQSFINHPKYRLAIVRSFKHGEKIDSAIEELKKQGRVDEYADAEMVARMLSIGRADAMFSMPVAWGPLISRNRLKDDLDFLNVSNDPPLLHGIVLSRQRIPPEIVDRLSHAMDEMRKDGSLEAIYQRYLPADIVKAMLP